MIWLLDLLARNVLLSDEHCTNQQKTIATLVTGDEESQSDCTPTSNKLWITATTCFLNYTNMSIVLL